MQDILDTIENSLYGMGEILGGLVEDLLHSEKLRISCTQER